MADPGWYEDPSGEPVTRYWDGSSWTQFTQPSTPPATPAPSATSTVATPGTAQPGWGGSPPGWGTASGGWAQPDPFGANGASGGVSAGSGIARHPDGTRGTDRRGIGGSVLRSVSGGSLVAAAVAAVWYVIQHELAQGGRWLGTLPSGLLWAAGGTAVGYMASDRRRCPGVLSGLAAACLAGAAGLSATDLAFHDTPVDPGDVSNLYMLLLPPLAAFASALGSSGEAQENRQRHLVGGLTLVMAAMLSAGAGLGTSELMDRGGDRPALRSDGDESAVEEGEGAAVDEAAARERFLEGIRTACRSEKEAVSQAVEASNHNSGFTDHPNAPAPGSEFATDPGR